MQGTFVTQTSEHLQRFLSTGPSYAGNRTSVDSKQKKRGKKGQKRSALGSLKLGRELRLAFHPVPDLVSLFFFFLPNGERGLISRLLPVTGFLSLQIPVRGLSIPRNKLTGGRSVRVASDLLNE